MFSPLQDSTEKREQLLEDLYLSGEMVSVTVLKDKCC